MNRYPPGPMVQREDALVLRRLAPVLGAKPQIGSPVSQDYLKNLAARIDAILDREASSSSPA